MKITISYVVDESNRRQGVQISYSEWKQLKQRLFDAEMQFWEIQKLETVILKADLLAAVSVVKEIEAGEAPTVTLADAFGSNVSINKEGVNPRLLVLPAFTEKTYLLAAKYPLLIPELLKLGKAQLGGFASIIIQDYITFGWLIELKKSKRQPAMRISLHFLTKHGPPDTISKEPLYLAAIYDKSDQKLVQPEPLELL